MKHLSLLALLMLTFSARAQNGYWQQQADYTMSVTLDDRKNTIIGTVTIAYTNHSPDTLSRIFFHTYWNALRNGSVTSVWAKENDDYHTDKRLQKLKPDEEGSMQVTAMKIAGSDAVMKPMETVLEVIPAKPLPPHSTTVIELEFRAQVPIAVSRAGRDNIAGIDFSMCQWYPKICRYDAYGWHADPYIGREFAGTFGSYDVKIALPQAYTVAGTGVLQNLRYLEKGYETLNPADKKTPKKELTTWHFKAEQVHDFAWAADKEYLHAEKKIDAISFHFFYRDQEKFREEWQGVIAAIDEGYAVAKENFGTYPYPQFSFIQAGEGYMEYPMCTFLEEGKSELLSTAMHEFMHSWYYGIFGTDENMYHWMDEGMTCYADARLYRAVSDNNSNPLAEALDEYLAYRSATKEEPASTFANFFKESDGYYLSAYYKGWLFIEQLRYIIGDRQMKSAMLRYYETWKFRHPEPSDLLRIMEKESGMELDWFKNFWIDGTKTIDYGIEELKESKEGTSVILKRFGDVPMPVEVCITMTDGKKEWLYIPLDLMYGMRPANDLPEETRMLEPWSFALRSYTIVLDIPKASVGSIEIDPRRGTADINRRNNGWKPKD